VPIRFRLALAFTGAAALLLAVGIWLFVSLVSSALLSSIDSQLATAAGLAGRYTAPASLTGPAGGSSLLQGEYLVQLIDNAGRVQDASPEAGSVSILGTADLRRARSQRLTTTIRLDGESTRVVAEPYAGHPGWIAVAAMPLEGYDRNVTSVQTGAAAAGAVLIVVAALGSYLLARRALIPVERMRQQVATLSATQDSSLIAVPPTNDELATLAHTMNDLLARLHDALSRERALVADASHELRTPLAVLSGELELAARPGRSTEELRAAVASAAEEVVRLNHLTEDLLFLARSDSGHLLLHRKTVAIEDLLRRAADAAAGRARVRDVRLEVKVPAGLRASVDPDRLRQAVDNLIDNALRVAPRNSAIELRAAATSGRLVVDVLDRGPGFPPDFLPVAFERFLRPGGDRAREGGGSGLGLAIVSVAATAHGGTAEARNRSDGGAMVRIDVPLVDPPGVAPTL
jgi:two-component system OmpR family sensor kinase